MSIATEITALNTNLTAAKNAVTTKGGTVGNTGLAGLATEIASIPSGGGSTPSEWGRITFKSFNYSWATTFSDNCTVSIVDSELFASFLAQNVPRNYGGISFNYDDGRGEWVTYDFYQESELWVSDLLSEVGVEAIIDDPDMGYASFELGLQFNISNTQTSVLELSEDMYNNMGKGLNDNTGFPCIPLSGADPGNTFLLPRDTVIGFEMGTEPSSIPDNFLAGCSYLTDFDITNASNLTSIGTWFMSGCSRFNDDIILPSTLTSIGGHFMYQCDQMVSTIDVGNLSANIIATTNQTLSTSAAAAPVYTTGITIAGANRAAWLSRFPNRTSSPYRKLLDAGH